MADVRQPGWHKLDSAARIFPSVDRPGNTTVFRISCTLTQPITLDRLRDAATTLVPRFPFFHVRLERGLFWHYLVETGQPPPVTTERHAPCQRILRLGRRDPLFRVLLYGSRISVEFSHILTDGFGALAYLRALTLACLDRPDLIEHPSGPDAVEDAYLRYHNPEIPPAPMPGRALQLRADRLARGVLAIVTGVLPLAPVLAEAKRRSLSLTEFFAALYMDAIYQAWRAKPRWLREKARPIRVMVPVNLRKLLPSRTLRNFFLALTPGIDPRLGEYTFDEIADQVHHQMRAELNDKGVRRILARNVRGIVHPILRRAPRLLKAPIERFLFFRFGNAAVSGVLSNLGPVQLPEAVAPRVRDFGFVTVPNEGTGVSAGVVSWQDRLYISFGCRVEDLCVPRGVLTGLRRMGIPVRIETNEQA